MSTSQHLHDSFYREIYMGMTALSSRERDLSSQGCFPDFQQKDATASTFKSYATMRKWQICSLRNPEGTPLQCSSSIALKTWITKVHRPPVLPQAEQALCSHAPSAGVSENHSLVPTALRV